MTEPISTSDQQDNQSDTAKDAPRFKGAGNFAPTSPTAFRSGSSYYVPERFGYRLKNKLLGPPLVNDQLKSERLPKSIALAVLSSDVMSSSAYATEAMLTVLIPAVGVAAFALVLPISLGVLVVLLAVTASYLQVIKAYPKAGGAYIVTRENFGPRFAQVAVAALLIDYTLTVAVSIAAGVDALTSAVPTLLPYTVELAVFFVVLIAYGNLRGIREAGRSFAIPTFLFIFNMGVLIVYGLYRFLTGALYAHNLSKPGAIAVGHPGHGLLLGASLFLVLNAFSNGGTALTGTEAISNGVSVFRDPQPRNARITLVAMSLILGTMFTGVSLLAGITHAIPRIQGSPTVVAQIATYVYGTSPLGRFLYFFLQASTAAILVLAANTSFTGFPFLASFAAKDSFLPRQFSKRGHRLVFSYGILVLAGISIVLLIVTRAQVTALIALYAIGVFTGFTLAGAGMVKHHLGAKEQGWRWRAAVNGSSAVLSFLVDIIFIVTKFKEGAWTIAVIMPILIFTFLHLHKEYETESRLLEKDLSAAIKEPVLKRHKVLVFVDKVDLATVKALNYARNLLPDQLKAVHMLIDSQQAKQLANEWQERGLAQIELEIVECEDRRLAKKSIELVLEAQDNDESEVSVVLPRRIYRSALSRILHDHTAETIADAIGQIPHATATTVPYILPKLSRRKVTVLQRQETQRLNAAEETILGESIKELTKEVPGVTPIQEAAYRKRAKVAGRVVRTIISSVSDSPSVTVRLEDSTGGIQLVFLGRSEIPGLTTGRRLVAEGTVGEIGGHLGIINPTYEFLDDAADD
ncbi:Amino acid transporter [Ferrithrix thermotolerans DSM 19514]|uniref:Amino acid transporter n=1 Tax=Ferrithrix thermotolerans DSM 19514 TaxID=1121881 RepID=A0A1M4TGK9_9ACTN|nr:amino acid permease [Ferrithrix thermotolerans]SHE43632.1 Amino acid transporter [Ferrithrix thermotolerans DSM 19514]